MAAADVKSSAVFIQLIFKEPLINPALPDCRRECTQSRQKSDGIIALFQAFLTKSEGIIYGETAAMD